MEDPEDYKWSSYLSYIGKKKRPEWLATSFILGFFDDNDRRAAVKYQEFVSALTDKKYHSPRKEAVAESILGRREFVESMKERYLGDRLPDRDVPALTELKRRPSFEELLNIALSVIGRDKLLAKKVVIYINHRYSGRALKDIGNDTA